MPLLVHCIPYPIVTTTITTMTIKNDSSNNNINGNNNPIFVRTNGRNGQRNFSDYDGVKTIFIRGVLKFEESFPAVPHAIPSSSVMKSSGGRFVIVSPVFRRAALIFTKLSIVARGNWG